MALSDCPECWDTPCICGYEYAYSNKQSRIKQAATILGVPIDELEKLNIPVKHPLENYRKNKEEKHKI